MFDRTNYRVQDSLTNEPSYKEWMDKHKIEGSFAVMAEEEEGDSHARTG